MDRYIWKAAYERNLDILRPMDELIVELSQRQRADEKIVIGDWLKSLYPLLSEEVALAYYSALLIGKTVDLDDMTGSFGASHAPKQVDQEMLSFGVDCDSLGKGVISGVVEGSTADIAGLKDKDKVLTYSKFVSCIEDVTRQLKIRIERDERQMEVD
jgi:predicted metalloprotease with PDZ domain